MARDYTKREVLGIIEREAQERGIPRDDFLRFAAIETPNFNEQANRGPNSAKGLFQFVPETARQYGILGQELDAVANTDAAARLYLDNRRALVNSHERSGRPYLSGAAEPNGMDMYMAHQQGAGGYASIQSAIATGNFSRGDTRAKILNNIHGDFREVSGVSRAEFARMGDREMAQVFTRYWDTKFAQVSIPEVGIEPLNRPGRETGRTEQPAAQQPAQEPAQQPEGRWPAPGNTSINQADKHREGRGEFGTPRSSGTPHGGVDIQGNVGDPIVAYAGGTVRVQPNNGNAGNTVTIDHGNGLVTRYFHLKDIGVEDGQRVEPGQQVGTMGRSGNTPRQGDTHLHFEMIRNGERVDPMRYLQPNARQQGEDDQAQRRQASDGLLKVGSRGAEVQALQTSLNELGYTGRDGKPLETRSGIFGPDTEHAVRAFQQAHQLTPADGKAGRDTRPAVEAALTNPLISEAKHPANGVYRAIGERLDEATANASPEVKAAASRPATIAAITLESMQEIGIRRAEDVRNVAVNGNGLVGVQGPTTGVYSTYTLSNSTPNLVELTQDINSATKPREQQTPVQSEDRVADPSKENPTVGGR